MKVNLKKKKMIVEESSKEFAHRRVCNVYKQQVKKEEDCSQSSNIFY